MIKRVFSDPEINEILDSVINKLELFKTLYVLMGLTDITNK